MPRSRFGPIASNDDIGECRIRSSLISNGSESSRSKSHQRLRAADSLQPALTDRCRFGDQGLRAAYRSPVAGFCSEHLGAPLPFGQAEHAQDRRFGSVDRAALVDTRQPGCPVDYFQIVGHGERDTWDTHFLLILRREATFGLQPQQSAVGRFTGEHLLPSLMS